MPTAIDSSTGGSVSECSDEAIQQLWSFVPGYGVSGIALHGGTVFLVADGIARALDAATGQERWRVAGMDASASATPVLVGGGVIEIGGVMHEDFESIRLDANDGAVIGPAEHRFSGDELEGEQERQLPEGYSIEAGALSYRGRELLELEDELISVGRVGSLSIVSYSYEEVVAVDDGGTVVWRCALGQPLVDPDAYPVLVEGDIAVVTGADWTVRGLRVTAADAPELPDGGPGRSKRNSGRREAGRAPVLHRPGPPRTREAPGQPPARRHVSRRPRRHDPPTAAACLPDPARDARSRLDSHSRRGGPAHHHQRQEHSRRHAAGRRVTGPLVRAHADDRMCW